MEGKNRVTVSKEVLLKDHSQDYDFTQAFQEEMGQHVEAIRKWYDDHNVGYLMVLPTSKKGTRHAGMTLLCYDPQLPSDVREILLVAMSGETRMDALKTQARYDIHKAIEELRALFNN